MYVWKMYENSFPISFYIDYLLGNYIFKIKGLSNIDVVIPPLGVLFITPPSQEISRFTSWSANQ